MPIQNEFPRLNGVSPLHAAQGGFVTWNWKFVAEINGRILSQLPIIHLKLQNVIDIAIVRIVEVCACPWVFPYATPSHRWSMNRLGILRVRYGQGCTTYAAMSRPKGVATQWDRVDPKTVQDTLPSHGAKSDRRLTRNVKRNNDELECRTLPYQRPHWHQIEPEW